MRSFVSITTARNKLSQLVNGAVQKQEEYVLLRDSQPQAVLIPWETYRLREERWQEEVKTLLAKGQKLFRKWRRQNKLSKTPAEDALYQLVNQTAGRY